MNKPPHRSDTGKLKALSSEINTDDTYSPSQINQFHVAEGDVRQKTLFVPVGTIIDTPNEADRPAELDRQIAVAGRKAGWSDQKIDQLQTQMKEDLISPGHTNADVILDQVGEAASAPYAVQVPKDYRMKASETTGIVLVPEDPDKKWKTDSRFFADSTGIENPERAFPTSDKVHALMLSHDAQHTLDPVALRLQGLPHLTGAQALGLEETGDVNAMPGFLKAYHDPEALRAFAHARAMAGVRGLADHFTSFDIDFALDPKNKSANAFVHAPDKVIDGETKLKEFLDSKIPPAVGFESGPGSDEIYRTLLKGMASGEIKDPNALAVARRYTEAFDYFVPSVGATIRAEVTPTSVPKKTPVRMTP